MGHPVPISEVGHPVPVCNMGHPVPISEVGHPVPVCNMGHPVSICKLGHPVPVCDGEYAGQLELVDGEMGRDRTTQVLILLPELSS